MNDEKYLYNKKFYIYKSIFYITREHLQKQNCKWVAQPLPVAQVLQVKGKIHQECETRIYKKELDTGEQR